MSSWNLMKRLKAAIMARLATTPDPRGAAGELSSREHEAIFALFQVVTEDLEFPFDRYRSFVDLRTREAPGMLDAYRRSVALLDRTATRRMAACRFARLPWQERERVLR